MIPRGLHGMDVTMTIGCRCLKCRVHRLARCNIQRLRAGVEPVTMAQYEGRPK